MTIFDAVRKEDAEKCRTCYYWREHGSDGNGGTGCSALNAPTIKAISLEDLRKEIEGMKKPEPPEGTEVEASNFEVACMRPYIYNLALSDLLKKLEDK